LLEAGIPVRIDAAHAISHNKVMVIDGETVITGSFNFTKAAEERNAENLLVVRDQALAARYGANWHQHKAHSQPYGAAFRNCGVAIFLHQRIMETGTTYHIER
jgi:phosphatidylserine/phosphatidylglycerophosphate/cardiolipin synthase-like enzyme